MPRPWHHADDRVRIAKLCVGPFENNVYVAACSTTGEAVIIDAAAEADRIAAACAGLSPVAVVTTHGHHDHVQAAAVAGRLGVPFLIHPADAALAGVPGAAPLEDGTTLRFGDLAMEVLHTPGHTPGSTSFALPGRLFTGDTLFPGGPGATGTPKAFARIMETLRGRLFPFPDDTVVHPGHGLDTTLGAERPHLDEWQTRGW